jgi:hypothetical protein
MTAGDIPAASVVKEPATIRKVRHTWGVIHRDTLDVARLATRTFLAPDDGNGATALQAVEMTLELR